MKHVQRRRPSDDLIVGALAGGGTVGGDVAVAAPSILLTGTVDVLVIVATGVGCNRRRKKRGFLDGSRAEMKDTQQRQQTGQ